MKFYNLVSVIQFKRTDMRKFLFTIVTLVILPLTIQAQMDIPPNGFNPRATISEEVGITSITIKYSRPGVKGREGKIWGEVVANGFGAYNFSTGGLTSPWRAGANKATTIRFEHDVKVEGKDLEAGTYALFMAMETNEVTLIFSRQIEAWGSFRYEEADDVLRVKIKPMVQNRSVEWLKYEFIDHREDGCTIAMLWEKKLVPFNIDIDVDKIVLARIREEFKGVKGFISANRIHASMYYFEKNTNLDEALSWAELAVTGKPFGQNPFAAYENLVNGYEKAGRTAEADRVLLEGLQIADPGQFTLFNKKLIRQGRSKTAVEIMLLAEKRFGDTFNVNNGLAHAYSAAGNYKKALTFAKKALTQATSEKHKAGLEEDIKNLKSGNDINR